VVVVVEVVVVVVGNVVVVVVVVGVGAAQEPEAQPVDLQQYVLPPTITSCPGE
jgi:hypothetical protein